MVLHAMHPTNTHSADTAISWLKQQLPSLLDSAEMPAPDDNLLDYGLDSLRMLQLLAGLTTQGIRLDLASFGRTPTLANWQALIARSHEC